MSETFSRGPVVGHVYASGEIQELSADPPRRRHTGHDGPRYIMIETTHVMDVMAQLSPTQHRILTLILSDYREDAPWARYTVEEMCHELGIRSPNFYRSLKPLREANLVIKISRTMWRVNPRYGWRGTRKGWLAEMKTAEPLNLEALT